MAESPRAAGAPVHLVGALLAGKYRLRRFIAAGGMGWVFEAQHEIVRRTFAVKVLRPELCERRDALRRFQREAAAAGALTSEHVAATLDFGFTDDGAPFLVMEHLEGASLADLLAQGGPLPVARAAELVRQACLGVQAAHDAGLLHRDLKPANLFVTRRADGTDWLKVLDFGIAKLREASGDRTLTEAGVVRGTPAYMSPEQARGARDLDGRTDVYALGVIVFEALAGRLPRLARGDDDEDRGGQSPPDELASAGPDLPVELRQLVGRCLEREPARRPTSPSAVAEALAPFARADVWPSLPAPPARSSETATASAEAQPGGRAPTSDGRVPLTVGARGRRLALVVAVLGATTAAWVLWSRPSRQAVGPRRWDSSARFMVPAASPGAVTQIAALEREGQARRAGLLTAMMAVPRAVWLMDGTPDEVERTTHTWVARAAREGTVPVFATYDLPYRDCAGYSAGGALDTTSFVAWIEAFARGLGPARAVVILEPDSLGILPYNRALDGTDEWCRPTVADPDGKNVPAPQATPEARYQALGDALERLEKLAPHASVYLDGTHPGWLAVGDVAYRLARAGVRRAQGFFLNVSNVQSTPHAIAYGSFVARCLAKAFREGDRPEAFVACPTPRQFGDLRRDETWAAAEAAYAKFPAFAPDELTHFVIDTSRNGRPVLSAARFLEAPFSQPATVVKALDQGVWCNFPGLGVGLRPTAATGVALVDAYLWVKGPGESDGSCDVAGGARAWDFGRYNPWGLSDEARRHFDPLWAMLDPAAGAWFPEQALELAENASPPWRSASDSRSETPVLPVPQAP